MCLDDRVNTRRTITFLGTVQGVGFRYTAVSIARRFNVSGWVRNEADGSVKCVVEGEPEELDRFMAAVQKAMDGYIRQTRVEESAAMGEFHEFGIRR
jgi:acylphosphatase